MDVADEDFGQNDEPIAIGKWNFDTKCSGYSRNITSIAQLMNMSMRLETERQPIPLFSTHRDKGGPQTLLVHDFCENFDQYEQGSANVSFTFRHWRLIDHFCYFTHNFVSVPPPAWINIAHQNGVSCLGCVMFEWEAGKAALTALLDTGYYSVVALARQLVKLARYCGFDGFLINIECDCSASHVIGIENLLRELRDSGLFIVWYDAVTAEGKLEWQNTVNHLNRNFLDSSSAIMLNYHWSAADVRTSVESTTDMRHTELPKPHSDDIYVGIDVHGRGVFGGGGLQTDLALHEIDNCDCGVSIALFAPAWTFESLKVKDTTTSSNINMNSSTNMNLERFLELDDEFWGKVEDVCDNDSTCGIPTAHLNAIGGFHTTFTTGFGHNFFKNGRLAWSGDWTWLNTQSLLPNTPLSCQFEDTYNLTHEVAFDGGSALLVKQYDYDHTADSHNHVGEGKGDGNGADLFYFDDWILCDYIAFTCRHHGGRAQREGEDAHAQLQFTLSIVGDIHKDKEKDNEGERQVDFLTIDTHAHSPRHKVTRLHAGWSKHEFYLGSEKEKEKEKMYKVKSISVRAINGSYLIGSLSLLRAKIALKAYLPPPIHLRILTLSNGKSTSKPTNEIGSDSTFKGKGEVLQLDWNVSTSASAHEESKYRYYDVYFNGRHVGRSFFTHFRFDSRNLDDFRGRRSIRSSSSLSSVAVSVIGTSFCGIEGEIGVLEHFV